MPIRKKLNINIGACDEPGCSRTHAVVVDCEMIGGEAASVCTAAYERSPRVREVFAELVSEVAKALIEAVGGEVVSVGVTKPASESN